MSLLAIKEHMMQVKIASLSTLCACLNTDADVLRHMLTHWERKGKIRKFTKTPACGSQCSNCPAGSDGDV